MTAPVPPSDRGGMAAFIHAAMLDTGDAWGVANMQECEAVADSILSRWRLVPVGSDDELVLLSHQGLTDRQIAEQFNLPTRTVAARRRKLGLDPNY